MKKNMISLIISSVVLFSLTYAQKDVYPNVMTSNFSLRENLILIDCEVNGKMGKFILDTGAPTLILNSAFFKGVKIDNDVKGVSSNSISTNSFKINKFKWGDFELNNFNAIAFPLCHLQLDPDQVLFGLIGQDLIKEYDMLLDYDNSKIVLSKDSIEKVGKLGKPSYLIDFNLEAHIPVFKINFGSKKSKFGIDTGAAVNLFSSSDLANLDKSLYSYTNADSTISLLGAGNESVQVNEIIVNKFSISNNSFENVSFISSNIDHLNAGYGLNIEGLLGYKFLSSDLMAISYRENKIKVWKK